MDGENLYTPFRKTLCLDSNPGPSCCKVTEPPATVRDNPNSVLVTEIRDFFKPKISIYFLLYFFIFKKRHLWRKFLFCCMGLHSSIRSWVQLPALSLHVLNVDGFSLGTPASSCSPTLHGKVSIDNRWMNEIYCMIWKSLTEKQSNWKCTNKDWKMNF